MNPIKLICDFCFFILHFHTRIVMKMVMSDGDEDEECGWSEWVMVMSDGAHRTQPFMGVRFHSSSNLSSQVDHILWTALTRICTDRQFFPSFFPCPRIFLSHSRRHFLQFRTVRSRENQCENICCICIYIYISYRCVAQNDQNGKTLARGSHHVLINNLMHFRTSGDLLFISSPSQ